MELSPGILLSGSAMVAVSIAFVVFALRRGGTWRYLGLGALAWLVTVAVKFLIAIPINPVVYTALYVPNLLWAPGSILFYVYVGLLTGLTEVLLSWLLLRYTRLGRVPWAKALAFGIGFGAFEAALLGFSSLASSISALAAPQLIPEAAMNSIRMLNDPIFALAPVAERFGTILVHVLCNVLLFYGVASGQARWLWVSFAYKSLLDTVAGFAQFWGVETLPKIWTIEALILIFGFVAWWGILQVKRQYDLTPTTEPVVQISPSIE
jgi:uncharacterized membrane protein YhfC